MALEDDNEFLAFRDSVVDEIRATLTEEGREHAADLAANIQMLLDWRWNYSTREFNQWHVADVDEFLLGWVPRKLLAAAEEGAIVCSAVAEFFVHMGSRDRIHGGPSHVAALAARAWELSDAVVDAMGDPNNFGVGKAMFASPASPDLNNPLTDVIAMIESGMSPDDPALQAALQAKVEEFNALPFDDRKAITDPGLAPRRMKIPVVNVPPTTDEVASSIASSRLFSMMEQLVDFVGPKGIPVTQSGNLRLAEARTLVGLLGTGDLDRFDTYGQSTATVGIDGGRFELPPRTLRSADELPVLSNVFEVAEQAGAFDRLKTKIKVSAQWLERSTIERGTAMVDALLDLGPISRTSRMEFAWELAMFLEDGIPHWLSLAIPEGAEIMVDGVIEQAVDTTESAGFSWPLVFDTPESRADWVTSDVSAIFAELDTAGVIEWIDRVEHRDAYGERTETGGWFRLTPLGRAAMLPHFHDAGYDFTTLPNLAEASASDLVNVLATTNVEPTELMEQWQPEWDTSSKARALAEIGLNADTGGERMTVVDALSALSPATQVAPIMRELLDSPLAGYAAHYLLNHDLADIEEMEAFITVAPLVDMLGTLLDEPQVLAEVFSANLGEAMPDVIEELWRFDHPDTVAILIALGDHLPDKKLAKAARKAVIQHRTWMANRADGG